MKFAPTIEHVKVSGTKRCSFCGQHGKDCTGEPYPEHARMKAVQEFSQELGEFLEWLTGEKGWTLCDLDRESDQFYPARTPVTEVLAEYFGIDLKKIEREKREMLALLRVQHAKREIRQELGI